MENMMASQVARDFDTDPNLQRSERAALLLQRLTARQRQVLEGMVDGFSNKRIASMLGIEEKTVKMHRAALLLRLDASNSCIAVRIGVEASFAPNGLVPPLIRLATGEA
jgi:DNA-binding NarL/FixJ family response regulator